MKKTILTLGALLAISSACMSGLVKRVSKEGVRFDGPTLTMYRDNNGDGILDEVEVRFVSSFTAGCMGYNRKPTQKEINWYRGR